LAEWLVEQGIGEDRAILVEGGGIVAARIDWPGKAAPGQVEDAVLVSRAAGSPRGTVRLASGEQALVDRLPQGASEGAALRVEIVRAAMAEAGRFKLAQARPSERAPRPAPTLAGRLRDEGNDVRVVRQFPLSGWDELFGEAWTGAVAFPGGGLVISPTPAMTVIDIDGALPPRALALAAVPAIAAAVRRLDLGGSIAIDFPTLADKADRRAIDTALAEALSGWPHERTAINGFGLVQLVARLERPSLLHRFAQSRAGAAARLLLRRAERVADPGALLITAHPAVIAAISPRWRDDLARRSGRAVRWQDDPALAFEAGFAQAIAP